MPPADSQAFLRDLDKKLWTAADRLRFNLDAAGRQPGGLRFRQHSRTSAQGFIQFERFIEEHGGKLGDLSVYGQEQRVWGTRFCRAKRPRRVRLRRKQPNQSNPTNWRLAAMKIAIRGIDFNFGKEPANSFAGDLHTNLHLVALVA